MKITLYGHPLEVDYTYSPPEPDVGLPESREITALYYQGVDVWPIYPSNDATLSLLEDAIADAEDLERQALDESRAQQQALRKELHNERHS